MEPAAAPKPVKPRVGGPSASRTCAPAVPHCSSPSTKEGRLKVVPSSRSRPACCTTSSSPDISAAAVLADSSGLCCAPCKPALLTCASAGGMMPAPGLLSQVVLLLLGRMCADGVVLWCSTPAAVLKGPPAGVLPGLPPTPPQGCECCCWPVLGVVLCCAAAAAGSSSSSGSRKASLEGHPTRM